MAKRRPTGDGMVRKREDGRWEGRIVVGHKDNGDSIFRYISAPTQKELSTKLRQLTESYKGVDLTEESNMSLSVWLDKWLDEYMSATLRPSTLNGYRRSLELHVKPYLGAKPLAKITAADLRSLYRILQETGRVHPRDGQSTGLHRGEICALQWDDLNFKTGELQVKRQVHRVKGELVVSEPKTKASNRSVILPAPVLMVLNDCKNGINSAWMFPSPLDGNSPRDPTAVRKRLTTILERANCKHIRFHDLRHTFATASLEDGMDVKTLSTIIGHVSTSTTLNVYAHVTDEMRKTAAAKIDRGIAKAKTAQDIDMAPRKPTPSTFQPYKGQRRKPGTGCIS